MYCDSCAALLEENERLRKALELVLHRADRGAVLTAQRPISLEAYFKTYNALTMRLSKEDFMALWAVLAPKEGKGVKE